MTQNKKEEKRQLWIARLCDLDESGMTQDKWCRNHNIPYSALRYWISKLKKESESEDRGTNWLKLDMSAGNEVATLRMPGPDRNNECINIRIGDFTVEISDGFNPQRVLEVLRMMKTI